MQNPFITTSNIPNPKKLPTDDRFGIDAVVIHFSLNMSHSYTLGPEWVRETKEKQGEDIYEVFERYFDFGHHMPRVTVFPEHQTCKIKLNAPKSISPTNETPFPVGAFKSLVEKLISQLLGEVVPSFVYITDEGEFLWQSDWETNVRIISIELARDFLIPEERESELQKALSAVTPKRNYLESDFRRKGGFTRTQSTKTNGKDTIYNKTAELSEKSVNASETNGLARYRFETLVKAERRDRYGLKTLASLSESRCWEAVCHRFEETGWNVVISSADSLRATLEKLEYKTKEKLLGYNTILQMGLKVDSTAQLRRDREKLARNIGLVLGLRVDEHPSGFSVLSLSHGGLVEIDPTI